VKLRIPETFVSLEIVDKLADFRFELERTPESSPCAGSSPPQNGAEGRRERATLVIERTTDKWQCRF
jgi:hypothetical protein